VRASPNCATCLMREDSIKSVFLCRNPQNMASKVVADDKASRRINGSCEGFSYPVNHTVQYQSLTLFLIILFGFEEDRPITTGVTKRTGSLTSISM
jgi:hypothetical protein